MLKLMIVDDDALVRFGIKSMIDWQGNGYEITGEAENGLDALSIFYKTHPDVILCDIKMPKMDGLELIKRIRCEDSRVKIIVLSYYSDLDIVKEALRGGADDYFLKASLSENELLNILDKYAADLKTGENKSNVNHYGKNDLIKSLIGWTKSDISIEKELQNLQINIKENDLFVISASIDKYKKLSGNFSDKDKHLLTSAVLNVISDVIKTYKNYELLHLTDNLFLILLNMPARKSESITNYDLNMLLCAIQTNIKKFTNFSISFGVSNRLSTFQSFAEGYKQSNEALEQSFYLGSEKIIFYSDDQKIVPFSTEVYEVYNNTIYAYIQKSDMAGLKRYMTEIREFIRKEKYSIKDVNFFITNIQYMVINSYLKKLPHMEMSSLYNENIEYAENLDEFFDAVLNLIDSITAISSQEKKYSYMTFKAIKYLDNHFTDASLSQKDVSDFLNVSTTYISTLFKKELNINFTEYLTALRIEKAIELLSTSSLKILDISNSIGFNDVTYFVKRFKKIKGVSPREYRDKCYRSSN